MIVSQLIEVLSRIREEHGDIHVDIKVLTSSRVGIKSVELVTEVSGPRDQRDLAHSSYLILKG